MLHIELGRTDKFVEPASKLLYIRKDSAHIGHVLLEEKKVSATCSHKPNGVENLLLHSTNEKKFVVCSSSTSILNRLMHLKSIVLNMRKMLKKG